MGVSFLYFGKIPQLNGAAVFFNSLIEKKEYFQKYLMVEVRFFCQRTSNARAVSPKKVEKRRIFLKELLNFFLPRTLMGCVLHFYIFLQRNAKRVVNQYLSEVQAGGEEILVFNDIFVGVECLKHKQVNFTRSILILHNDGNPLQMIIEGLPKLKKYKKLKKDVEMLIASVSRVVLLSKGAKDNFIKIFPDAINKAIVINNGVELPETVSANPFDIPHDRLFGISVGTISCRKGHDLLIRAMQNLDATQKQKITIFCLGNIGDDVNLSNCPKNLIFLAGVEHTQLSAYLKNVDFFIMCSRNEGVPLSILEAMQYSLPIFSTNVGGIPDIVNSNGILFNPTEPDIRNTLQKIIAGEYNFGEMAQQSVNLYNEYYSLDVMIKKYVSVIKEIEYE